jgi:hypothetical protein
MDAKAVEAPRTAGRWRRRLVVVAAAVVATVVVFLVITLIAGQELSSPAMNNQDSTEVNVGSVIAVSALASLVAWGLLALLERFTAKARTIWTIVAAVVLLLSLGGPLSGEDVSTGNRVGLVLLHLTVAAVLIPLLPSGWAREGRQAS